MTRTKILMVLAAAVLAARCATAPPPAVVPKGDDRFLVDPRAGYRGATPPALMKRFEEAWRFVLAGNETEARRRLAAIRKSYPEFTPALLAETVLDIRAGRNAEATKAVDALLEKEKEYTAALVYRAEIAAREKRVRAAWEQYRAIAARKDAPPFAAERLAQLQAVVFDELVAAARGAETGQSIRLLREALALNATAFEPRVLLVQRLLSQRELDAARKELDPLLDTVPDRSEVQELLAEIDVAQGRYEEAIVRYDRLARRTKDSRFAERLEAIKREWSAANMPAYYRAALQSPALTRADLAVLLYWNVPSIRFAQNLGTPPIATDVADVAGREEMIRAIAIGLYDVDPITRMVGPSRQISAERLARTLARVLQLRRAACATSRDYAETLAACGVDNPAAGREPDAAVTGAEALRFVEQVAKVL